MPAPRLASPLAAACLLLAAAPAAAAVSVTYAASIYADAADRPLKDVEGVACGAGGQISVADTGNGRILRYLVADKQVQPLAEWRFAELPYPTRLQLDAQGNLLVLDRKVQRLGRIDPQGKFLGYVAFQGVPGPVVPGAFKVEGESLYVLDLASVSVLVSDLAGNVARRLDLPRGEPAFTDVAVDPAGTVYAVDAAGVAVWAAERGAGAFKTITRNLRDAVSFPVYAAVSSGRIFLVDQAGNGLVALGLDGTFQGRFLAMGRGGGAVFYPAQICIGDAGWAALADRGNNRVQLLSLTR